MSLHSDLLVKFSDFFLIKLESFINIHQKPQRCRQRTGEGTQTLTHTSTLQCFLRHELLNKYRNGLLFRTTTGAWDTKATPPPCTAAGEVLTLDRASLR